MAPPARQGPRLLHHRKAELAEARMRMMSIVKTGAKVATGKAAENGEAEPPRPGFRVGAELREARERLGWALPDVAAGLRIRLAHLAAIEDGRLDELPGNAYAVMFLRTYAGALGLDADEAVRRFRAEAEAVNRKTELTFPAPVPERGVPAGALALLGILLAVGAYAGWYHFTGDRQNLAQSVPPLPARLAPLAQGSSSATSPAATPSPQVASVLPAAAPGDPPVPVLQMPQVPPTQASAAPMPPLASMAPPTVIQPQAVPAASAAAPATAPPSAPGAGRIVLRASANSWMQVREKQGSVLLNRVLRPGETWPVPADKASLLLTTGNAGGTELLVDGVLAPPIGNAGAVRRDLPLDADAIKDGKLASASPSPASGVPAAGSGSTPHAVAQ